MKFHVTLCENVSEFLKSYWFLTKPNANGDSESSFTRSMPCESLSFIFDGVFVTPPKSLTVTKDASFSKEQTTKL